MNELTICSRLLAAHTPPIGIYFVSEDMFTLSSYYLEDLRDPYFLPDESLESLEDKTVNLIPDNIGGE